jgi:hypothetical protein
MADSLIDDDFYRIKTEQMIKNWMDLLDLSDLMVKQVYFEIK